MHQYVPRRLCTGRTKFQVNIAQDQGLRLDAKIFFAALDAWECRYFIYYLLHSSVDTKHLYPRAKITLEFGSYTHNRSLGGLTSDDFVIMYQFKPMHTEYWDQDMKARRDVFLRAKTNISNLHAPIEILRIVRGLDEKGNHVEETNCRGIGNGG
ncbi:uncharacterized protein BDR25DRAFT_351644 [Lindgomyces ingoldianus]|uniref:Uncharacterized protein n=1 Tax=Lindgomyces ingoldianus TaxID=673940 RepID=A0ACB6R5I6_9PLEO|nr:uncharacterized protein BDR25DRAFT_351644 [Lindgomyces ingoldianus]KAF2474098.1 hypothetical protein BDR25DRAFT_351644 [Lindgomyces ingoldianus]